MSEKSKFVNEGKTRGVLDDAMKEFRSAADPDKRLHSLWKISQLAEDATDAELYELASATVVEKDHRLRGELCYTISRSQRPELAQILRGMMQDENPYVRRSAITAIGELGGKSQSSFGSIEPILKTLDELKKSIESMKEEMIYLRESVRSLTDTETAPRHEIIMDDYMRSWETYLRHERELFREHKGEYVAIYREEIVGIDTNEAKLARMVQEKYGPVEALICMIEEEREPIQISEFREIVG